MWSSVAGSTRTCRVWLWLNTCPGLKGSRRGIATPFCCWSPLPTECTLPRLRMLAVSAWSSSVLSSRDRLSFSTQLSEDGKKQTNYSVSTGSEKVRSTILLIFTVVFTSWVLSLWIHSFCYNYILLINIIAEIWGCTDEQSNRWKNKICQTGFKQTPSSTKSNMSVVAEGLCGNGFAFVTIFSFSELLNTWFCFVTDQSGFHSIWTQFTSVTSCPKIHLKFVLNVA